METEKFVPRILFVGMPDSPHVARWIDLVASQDWEMDLFPIYEPPSISSLASVVVHRPCLEENSSPVALPDFRPPQSPTSSRPALERPFYIAAAALGDENVLSQGWESLGESGMRAPIIYSSRALLSLVDKLKPDLIHSMEFQHSGYLVSAARAMAGVQFPPWLATNWGSDIIHFKNFEGHRIQIRRLLGQIDYYSCECHRDIFEAQALGYRGAVMPVLPNSGGFDLRHIAWLQSGIKPSNRKRLMVKGYQHFAGRALTALAVLESLKEELTEYEIILYSAMAEPRAKAQQLINDGLLNIKFPGRVTHNEMLRMFGVSRLYLGVSMSDGISTSVLESMAMGSFPIQSNTACCGEWFEEGIGGLLADPDDFEDIRSKVRRALLDDDLVDNAVIVNRATVEGRLDRGKLRPQVRAFYQAIFDDISMRRQFPLPVTALPALDPR